MEKRQITLNPKKHLEKKLHEEQIMRTYALLVIKYGIHYSELSESTDYIYNERQIAECWNYELPTPSAKCFLKINTPTIKDFIINNVKLEHPIWNADFLSGLSKHATVIHKDHYFPSLKWRDIESMDTIIMSSPLGGRIGKAVGKHTCLYENKRWLYVPALLVNGSGQDTCSYVAGLLCAGVLSEIDGFNYIRYKPKVTSELKRLGIPIEKVTGRGKQTGLISPFWTALFTPFMPEIIREEWLNVKKAYRANDYAAIMWRAYSKLDFKKGSIPYLKSRRSVYYDFKCEEGAIQKLEGLRFDYNLIEISLVVKEMVKYWENNNDDV